MNRRAAIGPVLPPGFRSQTSDPNDEEDDIGPSLPPTSRRRVESIDDDANIGPSIRSNFSRHNDDTDVGIGPSLPPSFRKRSESYEDEASIGPALPPHLRKPENKSISSDEPEGEDPYGPALPPHLRNRQKETAPSPAPGPSSRRKGPSLPANFTPAAYVNQDDGDDDVVGPLPLPEGYEHLVEEMEQERRLAEIEARAQPVVKTEAKVQREEWMLVPPQSKGPEVLVGMKGRSFASKSKSLTVDQSEWTALPGDRKEKPKDETNKRKRMEMEHRQLTQEEITTQNFVQKHNEAIRPKSLMDMHTNEYVKAKKFEEEDVSKRRFDRDKDLGARRIDSSSRQKLMEQAGQLDSKFSHGSKKTFL
ncbi:hypothetical protein BC829DRAFT_391085 [Chytridium lagenaria]|nr:hypothetical protein BC829DRAFT_391085 [Chytridium lagenaria]